MGSVDSQIGHADEIPVMRKPAIHDFPTWPIQRFVSLIDIPFVIGYKSDGYLFLFARAWTKQQKYTPTLYLSPSIQLELAKNKTKDGNFR